MIQIDTGIIPLFFFTFNKRQNDICFVDLCYQMESTRVSIRISILSFYFEKKKRAYIKLAVEKILLTHT